MDGAKLVLFELLFEKDSFTVSANFNLIIVFIIILLIACVIALSGFIEKKYHSIHKEVVPIKLKYKAAGAQVEYKVVRSYQNIEIAHKIYIELITRKAAIEIDEDNDVIVEIYDSWYTLFHTTREELKSFEGSLLLDNKTSQEVVRLLTDILNQGMRPHLTKYQAKFRKWYAEKLKSGDLGSPQDIQKEYPEYQSLMNSIKEVNSLLIQYAEQLSNIINGNK